ncbi:related to RPEL repeat [Lecanosticta acicola]|uniref:Related to RPEL repeat n=1 Tax=Lecanosticta acicola TaxID=111012 RepID=A0AAI8YXH0_9PEZI|nr:related to RPEL repeat [Lecanosticta acicola]
MASPQEQNGGVETELPPPLERRNSLEKHLQNRPEEQDLKDRHILLDTTAAPALQARAAELERQRITDNLKKGLAKRPEKDELVERNILPDSSAAPAIQANQKELEKHMRADHLDKALQQRPEKEELIKEGILKEGRMSKG